MTLCVLCPFAQISFTLHLNPGRVFEEEDCDIQPWPKCGSVFFTEQKVPNKPIKINRSSHAWCGPTPSIWSLIFTEWSVSKWNVKAKLEVTEYTQKLFLISRASSFKVCISKQNIRPSGHHSCRLLQRTLLMSLIKRSFQTFEGLLEDLLFFCFYIIVNLWTLDWLNGRRLCLEFFLHLIYYDLLINP